MNELHKPFHGPQKANYRNSGTNHRRYKDVHSHLIIELYIQLGIRVAHDFPVGEAEPKFGKGCAGTSET